MTRSVISIFSGASEVLDILRVALYLHLKDYLFKLSITINFQSLPQYGFFAVLYFIQRVNMVILCKHAYFSSPSMIYPKKIGETEEMSPLTALSSSGEVVNGLCKCCVWSLCS